MGICAAELVEERGLVVHCPDEDQPVVAFERGSRVRDDLRLGLQHKDADWADRIHHRAIPNDCTRYVMSTLRVVTSCVSARERTARSLVGNEMSTLPGSIVSDEPVLPFAARICPRRTAAPLEIGASVVCPTASASSARAPFGTSSFG